MIIKHFVFFVLLQYNFVGPDNWLSQSERERERGRAKEREREKKRDRMVVKMEAIHLV